VYVVLQVLWVAFSHVFIHSNSKKGHPFWSLAGRSFLRTVIIASMLKLSVQASLQSFQAFVFPLTLCECQLNMTGRNLWWNGSCKCSYSDVKRAVHRWCIQKFIRYRETGLLFWTWWKYFLCWSNICLFEVLMCFKPRFKMKPVARVHLPGRSRSLVTVRHRITDTRLAVEFYL